MKLLAGLFALVTFGASGAGAWYLANLGADELEAQTRETMGTALSAAGQDWVEVSADGLTATLSGTAPSEAARFRALDVAEAVLREEQITDAIVLADAQDAPPEPVALDVLMTRDLVTLIGNLPVTAEAARDALVEGLPRRVVDLTRLVDTEPATDWTATLDLLADIVPQVETGQIAVVASAFQIDAALPDAATRDALVTLIEAGLPADIETRLGLTAPRMTLSPYPFAISMRDGAYTLDACAAETDAQAERFIRRIAAATGMTGLDCTIALGAPDGNWPDMVELGIELAGDLTDASVTLQDRVMVLTPSVEASPAVVESITERARTRLPEGYSLLVSWPEDEDEGADPIVASRPKGLTLTIAPGRLSASGGVAGAEGVETLESYARTAYPARELELGLIADEPGAAPQLADALALLDTLGRLDSGTIRVDEGEIRITGTGEGVSLGEDIGAVLEGRLSGGRTLDIAVEGYERPVLAEPVADLPDVMVTPEECEARIVAAQARERIIFAPSSATLDISSAGPLGEIAAILADCPGTAVEIAGYTDSSGGEEMNRNISQLRADSVLDALLARGVFLDRMTAIGYGEEDPIADNATPEGREENRRIEFRVTLPTAQDEGDADDPAAVQGEQEDEGE